MTLCGIRGGAVILKVISDGSQHIKSNAIDETLWSNGLCNMYRSLTHMDILLEKP